MHDLRLAIRILAKSPASTALSILSITLGIGLTAGLFSVVDAMFLRPLPIANPGEILRVASHADDGQELSFYGWPDYLDMRRSGDGLVTLVAYQRRASELYGADGNLWVLTSPVTANYFSVLGVRGKLGQTTVEPAEGRPQVVIGHQLWQRRFGGDPHVVGSTLLLNDKAFRVAGVAPRDFGGLIRGVTTDIWMDADAWFTVFGFRRDEQSRNGQFEIFARSRPGVSRERAAAVLDAAIRGQGKHKPAPPGKPGTFLEPAYAQRWTDNLSYGGGLLLILGAILFVACANVAQLRMAQAEARRLEMSVRIALGAGAGRVARQALVESGLIAVAGTGLGILVARILMRKAAEFLAAGRVYVDYNIHLDARVLAYTVAALLFSVIFSGLAPARQTWRLNVAETLKAWQGSTGARGGWQRNVLIVGQLAVSVALFGSAVLFVAGLRNAAAVRPGMDPAKKLLVLTVGPQRGATASSWAEPACERLSALPGVRGATYSRRLPLSRSGGGFTVRAEAPGIAPLDVLENNVGAGYFSLMGTRVVMGRGIGGGDREGGEPVVVVSEAFATRLLPGRNPLGEWIKVDGVNRRIVGIAEDGPSNSLHETPQLFLFLPYTQVALGDLTLLVETAGEPAALEHAVRQELLRYDSRSRIYSAGTLQEQMDVALSWDRMMATIASGLGVFGVILTAAGLFGMLQYTVNRRMRELGLRVAMGAGSRQIERLILGESLKMALWGVPIGLALLVAVVRAARSMVLGVSPLDWRIYCFSAAAVVLVALAAGWLPARRATQVDPIEALRPE